MENRHFLLKNNARFMRFVLCAAKSRFAAIKQSMDTNR